MKSKSDSKFDSIDSAGYEKEEDWTKVIRAENPWFRISLRELWNYRDLIVLFVRRDFVAMYKQTILGPIWFLLAPLFTTVVFTVVFGRIAKIPTDGVPHFLFYMAGTVCWGYFSGCLTETSNTFVKHSGIFSKVYFPRLVVPISIVISSLLKFLIQLMFFLAFLVYYCIMGADISPSLGVLALPLWIVEMAVLGLACGILISSMTTRYRDLIVLVGFGVQLWMYATPVVYPLSQIPEQYRTIYALNPMVAVVEGFRQAFLGTSASNIQYAVLSCVVTLILLFAGLVLFSRIEKTFLDTV